MKPKNDEENYRKKCKVGSQKPPTMRSKMSPKGHGRNPNGPRVAYEWNPSAMAEVGVSPT